MMVMMIMLLLLLLLLMMMMMRMNTSPAIARTNVQKVLSFWNRTCVQNAFVVFPDVKRNVQALKRLI